MRNIYNKCDRLIPKKELMNYLFWTTLKMRDGNLLVVFNDGESCVW